MDQDSAEIFQENIRLKENIKKLELQSNRFEQHPSIHCSHRALEESIEPVDSMDNSQTERGEECKTVMYQCRVYHYPILCSLQ